MSDPIFSPAARWLGYAGLLPQAIAVLVTLGGGPWSFVAFAGGFAYAALIFSFLGGIWWGMGVASGRGTTATYLWAVMPSLLALALFLPWTLGWQWPGPSLLWLGLLLGLSPLVDRALGLAAPGFMRLRWQLSVGLGTLTAMLGILALQ